MNCPNCNQYDTQKVSVAYQMGTTSIQSSTIGLAGGRIGDRKGLGLGVSSSSGTQQSLFIQSIKPPEKENNYGLFVGCTGCFGFIVLSIIIGIIVGNYADKYAFWSVVIIIIGFFYGFMFLYKISKDTSFKKQQAEAKWKEEIEKYEKQWICLRCGSIFIPDCDQ